jgi:hypothetical protein
MRLGGKRLGEPAAVLWLVDFNKQRRKRADVSEDDLGVKKQSIEEKEKQQQVQDQQKRKRVRERAQMNQEKQACGISRKGRELYSCVHWNGRTSGMCTPTPTPSPSRSTAFRS